MILESSQNVEADQESETGSDHKEIEQPLEEEAGHPEAEEEVSSSEESSEESD